MMISENENYLYNELPPKVEQNKNDIKKSPLMADESSKQIKLPEISQLRVKQQNNDFNQSEKHVASPQLTPLFKNNIPKLNINIDFKKSNEIQYAEIKDTLESKRSVKTEIEPIKKLN